MRRWLLIIAFVFSLGANAGTRFEKLAWIIKHDGRSDIGSALGEIKKHPEFLSLFSNYTLGKNSLSLQTSTDERPRVIMFGNDGRLILTFNSDPSFGGGSSLESVEFNPITRLLEFREIVFKAELPDVTKKALGKKLFRSIRNDDLKEALSLDTSEIAFENRHIAITTKNPTKCLLCHRSNDNAPDVARYIWRSYPVWTGFFGTVHDVLGAHDLDKFKNLAGPAGQGKPGHDRYKNLDLGKSPNFPYLTGEGHREVAGQPNNRLTLLLGGYQAEVYAGWIERRSPASELKSLAVARVCGPAANETIAPQIEYLEAGVIPSSLAIPADDQGCFNTGSVPLLQPRQRGCLEDVVNWVLARDYMLSQAQTKPFVTALEQRNFEVSTDPKTLREIELLQDANSEFARVWAKYYSFTDFNSARLCQLNNSEK